MIFVKILKEPLLIAQKLEVYAMNASMMNWHLEHSVEVEGELRETAFGLKI